MGYFFRSVGKTKDPYYTVLPLPDRIYLSTAHLNIHSRDHVLNPIFIKLRIRMLTQQHDNQSRI